MQNLQRIKKVELEYKKLLAEYNTISISLASATIGIAALIYALTNRVDIAVTAFIFSFLIISSVKENKSKELDEKIKEI